MKRPFGERRKARDGKVQRKKNRSSKRTSWHGIDRLDWFGGSPGRDGIRSSRIPVSGFLHCSCRPQTIPGTSKVIGRSSIKGSLVYRPPKVDIFSTGYSRSIRFCLREILLLLFLRTYPQLLDISLLIWIGPSLLLPTVLQVFPFSSTGYLSVSFILRPVASPCYRLYHTRSVIFPMEVNQRFPDPSVIRNSLVIGFHNIYWS